MHERATVGVGKWHATGLLCRAQRRLAVARLHGRAPAEREAESGSASHWLLSLFLGSPHPDLARGNLRGHARHTVDAEQVPERVDRATLGVLLPGTHGYANQAVESLRRNSHLDDNLLAVS